MHYQSLNVKPKNWSGFLSTLESSLKRATPQLAHLEKFGLNFSSLLFVIHVNLLHPGILMVDYDL